MAKKEKKTNQTGLALACWILGFLILLIVFLVKQDEIYSNLKTTRFFERIFGSTPEFIANHKVKEEPKEEEETIITLKTEEPVKTPAQNVVSSEPVYVPKEEPKVQPKTEDKEASSKAETQAQTKPQETTKTETKVEQPKPVTKTVVNQKLYFVYIGEDGVVSRKVITREVEKNDSPLVTNINLLLKGPNSAEEGKGYKTLIPPGTKLISAYVRDGVAFLNFNEEFEFNRIGVDGYLAQLMQIVYTATEFSTVKSVQFLIDGQKKEYLGSEGVWIGSPLSRTSF